ncbi:MAG: SCO1/SenC family protein/methylamine utilization protein MauG [Methylococcaceae bacterium NSP1-1]|nr:MAG: SCO1/SenC family protein/methylamine utilization protein MauG [Methylococcaceae bacterium NSP1-1]
MNKLNLLILRLVILSVFAINYSQADTKPPSQQQILAPGYGTLEFTAPEPGSYTLPALGSAADGKVLDTQGNALTLHSLMGDKVVLLSFIYSTCSDINGCPLATAVLHKIKNRLKKEPELAEKLRLVTLSFNPEHDTPEMMQHYAQELQGNGVEWRFLTTQSEQDLQPILEHYKQNIQKVYDAQGQFTGTFSHILRVYLIDKNKQLRNIYSVAFLHPDTLINDIKTLLQTEPKQAATHLNAQKNVVRPDLYSPGDNKSNYEHGDYHTHSIALTDRVGQATNLLKTVKKPPLGLPAVPVPANNPLTKEKISLGRKLFYDRRLSLNNTFSCAMCHVPEQGFTSNEMATAVGIEGRTVRRNSPTLYNIAYARSLFHDSRETTLEQQIWAPLLAHNEMANPSIGYVIEKINNSADYNGLFKEAFGKEPSMETVGMAIASYERTLNSANSAFDRWYYGKDKQALDAKAQRGFQLFNGKANCSSCHSITRNHALFTDNNNHNTGIGYAEAMGKTDITQRVQVAPGVYVEVAATVITAVAETKPNDLGRYEVTQKPEDRWKYKTPSLRNVSLTAPYMHNGTFETLQQVVEFYNHGGIANENLDPLIKPLNLTEPEIADLTAFLESLTGDNVKELVADAFAAPIGDTE